MKKIELNELITILKSDVLTNNSCIEMNFSIKDNIEYKNCWIGKMPDDNKFGKEVYWFGLVEDGSQGYEYNTLDDLITAKVFNGKSLSEIFNKIIWSTLDGSSFEERLSYYINE
ncbi:MAG: hypothetical protein E6248_11005 [Clostridium sp.]|uniref:hypothetical protein n=1 Tax=Clostridium sp. TaxID=1506 RepID=UPI0029109C4B|nr:hypothetical protein [Clostridium sp.]MDU5110967.1 hypothetical protein [Clostridium sp.]